MMNWPSPTLPIDSHLTYAVLQEVAQRYESLMRNWYAEYLGESPLDRIMHGGRIILDNSGLEPPDVVLFRKMLVALGIAIPWKDKPQRQSVGDGSARPSTLTQEQRSATCETIGHSFTTWSDGAGTHQTCTHCGTRDV